MKKRFIILLLPVVSVLVFSAFRHSYSPADTINQNYLKGLKQFELSLNDLLLAVDDVRDEAGIERLQDLYIKARNIYKGIEYLVAYSDPEFVKEYLNGPPLPRVDRQSASEMVVLQPEGMQILEEMLFSAEALSLQAQMKEKILGLTIVLRDFSAYQYSTRLTDREVMEALRQGLVRIFTLGLTGFDTPGSGNAMKEAAISFGSLHHGFKQYATEMQEKNPALYKKIDSLFSAGEIYLSINQDFDSFDRLHFLTAYINPLYAWILEAHQSLGYETIEKIAKLPLPVSYPSKNLFAEDFLNPAYFASADAGIPNPAREYLGKMLFFDPVLSKNNERACASCHMPDKAFSDGRAKSLALNFEGTVNRNAPTLINSVYADRYFHDLRSDRLDDQTEHVIFNKKEFDTDFEEIFSKLKQSEEYKNLFESAFPGFKDPMSSNTLTTALAAYVRSLSGFNSPFDQYVLGKTKSIDPSVQRGFNLFMGKAVCGTCHFAPVFNGTVPPNYQETESEVLGVPAAPDTIHAEVDPDKGRSVNGRPKEFTEMYDYAFKTPTVRNVALTAPYMHNGVYATLDQVMDFYNRGGGQGIGIKLPNQTLPFDNLNLNSNEMRDIIAFMNALTDTTGITSVPAKLPAFPIGSSLNKRVIGGKY